ncbi:MAG: putative cytosol aminopeptidase [bacterium]|nr:MAG: putative cytosol aminopeptidase [bacterium]
MKIEVIRGALEDLNTPLLIINYFKDDIDKQIIKDKLLVKLDQDYDGLIQQSVERMEMRGESSSSVFIPEKNRSLLLLGSGKLKDFDVEDLKSLTAKGIRRAKSKGFTQMAFYIRGLEDMTHRISLLTESLYVGNYSFDLFKGKPEEDKPKTVIESIQIISESTDLKMDQRMAEEGEIIGQSINFAQDMINRPANHCTPTILAEQARDFSSKSSLELTILEQKDVESMNMGSFLSVAAGSKEPLKFIVMRHNPSTKTGTEKIALVGKGVTFDTGGISLKPSANMHEMKGDMSGAAAVIGAMVAISMLNLPIEVIGIVPATENMPSGNATKPGDIVKAMNGTTIEVLNTDAEGRLILADALCYAVKEKATRIIDVATLTGACVVALGEITTGVLGNDQDFVNRFMETCHTTGEKIWQLPLFKKYHEQLKSDVADLANIGGKYAGTITAASFLEKFVDKTPWIHLDIAGTNWASNENYHSKGGTGIKVTSFVHFIKELAS